MPSLFERARSAYKVLRGNPFVIENDELISSYVSSSAGNYRVSYDSTSSVLSPIQTRIAIDVASVPLRHAKVDLRGKFLSVEQSELNDRLSLAANIDQTGTAFIQDAAMTMLETGTCVLFPTETSEHPSSGNYDILSMRVGTVSEWYNYSVKVEVYNELEGRRAFIIVPKSYVAIIYNPLYAVMNEPNSTMRRLIDKLALLDVADGRLYSAQLDLILQMNYVATSPRQKTEARRRLEELEDQLYNRKYGIVYVDSNEKITQINRPVPNSLMQAVEGLTQNLHSQLGLTPAVFMGTASQEEMLVYNNKTVYPILRALAEGMTVSFFSRAAIKRGNTVKPIQDLFKMAPLSEIADAADKLTRNEIMSSNEVRAEIGLVASDDPNADELRNKNLNKSDQGIPGEEQEQQVDPNEKEQ
jgi:hypothetical protein